METIFHIIFLVLFFGVCFCAGWSFASCIKAEKKYNNLIQYCIKELDILKTTNKNLIEIIKANKKIIANNGELLKHTDDIINYLKTDIKFIKQNMIRVKLQLLMNNLLNKLTH